jgi:hypothetical protein
LSIKDALSAQVELSQPTQCLICACRARLQKAYGPIFEKFLNPIQRFGHCQWRIKSTRIRCHMQKFSNHQSRENQLFAFLGFGLDSRDCFCVCRMIGKGKLDKDIAIQANHYRPNISSPSSSCEMMGVNTRCPLMERMFRAVPAENPFSEAETILATGWLPCVSNTSSPALTCLIKSASSALPISALTVMHLKLHLFLLAVEGHLARDLGLPSQEAPVSLWAWHCVE